MAVLFAALAAAAACRGDGASEVAYDTITDTLPGGAVRRVVAKQAQVPSWHLKVNLRIGTVEGRGPSVFGNVRDLLVDGGGTIYVLDGQAQEVRVFDSSGTHVRTFGRSGAGPGEFRRANGLAWTPDGRIVVNDPMNARYALFAPTGDYITSYSRPVAGFTFRWQAGVDTTGKIWELVSHFEGPVSLEPGVYTQHPRRYLKSVDPETATSDSVELPMDDVPYYRFPRGAKPIPFWGRRLFLFDPRGMTWSSAPREYRIAKILFSGDTILVIERDVDPVRVTPEERDEAIGRVREFMNRAGTAELDYSLIPDTKPTLVLMTCDDEDRLWVWTRTTDPRGRFDVYDDNGYLVAEARADFVPSEYSRLVIRNGSMYAVVRDSLDVEYIVRARIYPETAD